MQMLICPISAQDSCVKELVNLEEEDCGRTDSYNREWQNLQPGDGTFAAFPLWPYT